jgi:hypothetical protein
MRLTRTLAIGARVTVADRGRQAIAELRVDQTGPMTSPGVWQCVVADNFLVATCAPSLRSGPR